MVNDQVGSTEWRDRGIIPNEHLASGTEDPWSTWRSLNRLRVQKGPMSGHGENVEAVSNRCDCGERQTMSHLMTCDDAPNCTMDRLGYLNSCRCQLCQTLGGIYLTAAIDDSTKKMLLYIEVYLLCCHYVMCACYIRRICLLTIIAPIFYMTSWSVV